LSAFAVLSTTATAVRIALRVQPRAAHARIAGVRDGRLKVQVTAPPVDGAANDAVVALIAAWIGVPRRTVRVIAGLTAREKVVEIASASPSELGARVAARLADDVDIK
jgi:uncharacterized protein (TIGR00251 family)